jgi:thioredoxin reductase (NADPH)
VVKAYKRLDCLVIGAGPAGLTAALYLARFGRRFAIVDWGDSRASRIPATHTLPMFSKGISGRAFLRTMRNHLERYGVAVRHGEVISLRHSGSKFEARLRRGDALVAAHVILCTGALDVELEVPGLESAVRNGHIRYCPVCDGPEVAFRNIAVVGGGAHAAREALFIATTYSRRVTLLTLGRQLRLSPQVTAEMRRWRVAIVSTPVVAIDFGRSSGAAIQFADGTSANFDTIYSALGLAVRSALALQVGAACDGSSKLRVNARQETSTPGLYAAGGVVRGLDQLLIAMGQAAVAATDVHNKLDSPAARVE